MNFPDLPHRTGLGVGLDLPWGCGEAGVGFLPDTTRGGVIAPRVPAFFARHAATFATAFFSWQPRSRSRLRLEDYAPAWDTLMEALPPLRGLGLHQTTLNLGALEGYDRDALCAFTNALCRRYGLGWVNEDLGLWSLHGRPLPYPLPPYLTDGGLAAAIRNVRDTQARLEVPLVVEFPGFSEGTSFFIGPLHAYDFFAALARATGVAVTLDLGHLLSYQWVRGARGEALYAELDRLPLDHVCELHLSGCEIAGEAFFDSHHGVLLDEQLVLLDRLIDRCPKLAIVTYEDPRIDPEGALTAPCQPGFARLQARVEAWRRAPAPAPAAAACAAAACAAVAVTAGAPAAGAPVPAAASAAAAAVPAAAASATLDEALEALLLDPERRAAFLAGDSAPLGLSAADAEALATLDRRELVATARRVRDELVARQHRGSGGLETLFSATLRGGRTGALDANAEAAAELALFERFLASPAYAAFRELPYAGVGQCIEEAFYRFAEATGLGDPAVREREYLAAAVKAVLLSPEPSFALPAELRAAPAGGALAITTRSAPPVLFAGARGRYATGVITPFVAELLLGDGAPEAIAARHGVPAPTLERACARLRELGLWP